MLTSHLTSSASLLSAPPPFLPFSFMSQLEIRELHAKENPSAKHIIILHRISAAQLISLPTELISFSMSASPVKSGEILDLRGEIGCSCEMNI